MIIALAGGLMVHSLVIYLLGLVFIYLQAVVSMNRSS